MSTGNQPGKIACPHCQALIKSPALAAGSLVNCPKCEQGFRLGEGSGFGVQGSGTKEVQGSKSKIQSREPGPVVPGSKNVQGQQKSAPIPPPPPPRTMVRDELPRSGVAGGAAASAHHSVPGTQLPDNRAALQSPPAPTPQSAIRNPQSSSVAPRPPLRGPRSPDPIDP